MSFIESSDWSRVPERGHGVQFYNDDDQLLRFLVRYVGTSLVSGDVALIAVTRPHRQALERRLAARGLDVNVARTEGRYLPLDAQATLDKFLCGGHVDEPKTHAVLGEMLRRAAETLSADGQLARVFAFGEVVALLAAQVGPEEALKLEEIWNALGGHFSFTLCCAYPMGGFTQRHAAPFVRICAQHSHVFHASLSRRAEAADRLK